MSERIDFTSDNLKWEIDNDGFDSTNTNVKPLSTEFGRNLDSITKARQWATNPNNWHNSNLFVIKWDGLLCTVSREHGLRLQVETWDDGIPWCIMSGQSARLGRSARGEELDEKEIAISEDLIST